MEETHGLTEELARRAERLPLEMQKSVLWLLSNWEEATAIVAQEHMSDQAWEDGMKRAIEQKDTLMQLLFLYHRVYWQEKDRSAEEAGG